MGLKTRWENVRSNLGGPEEVTSAGERRITNKRAEQLVEADDRVILRHDNETLKRQLSEERAKQPIQVVNPKRVRPSAFMNRHPQTFEGEEYKALVEDIGASGGNTVEVRVRRISHPDFDFEIIAGHRRHRAAIDAGTDLRVIVEAADDRHLYETMTRENSQRQDLSPWEWGGHYVAGLKIYPNQKELAKANGRSEAHVAKALDLARLPPSVVEAFPSPLELQLAWGASLRAALEKAEASVLDVARSLSERTPRPPARTVFSELIRAARRSRGGKSQIKKGGEALRRQLTIGKTKATLSCERGVTTIQLKRAVTADQMERLEHLVRDFLQG